MKWEILLYPILFLFLSSSVDLDDLNVLRDHGYFDEKGRRFPLGVIVVDEEDLLSLVFALFDLYPGRLLAFFVLFSRSSLHDHILVLQFVLFYYWRAF
jgi:hypothetical protein